MSVVPLPLADAILGFGSLSFIAAMFPTMFDKTARVPRITSLLTTFTLLAFLLAYGLLGLWFAFIMDAVLAACWAFVTVYRGETPRKEM